MKTWIQPERISNVERRNVMLSRFSDFEDTFAVMDELRRRMDRVWEDVDPSLAAWQSVMPSSRATSASVFPRINLFDTGSDLVLKADVPGMSEKDIQVSLNEGGISISGERKVVAPEGYAAHRQERSHVRFSRTLTLPCKVNAEQTTATVKNGVLTVTLAKAAEAQPRQITVRAN
jgi:HSP20 family protein